MAVISAYGFDEGSGATAKDSSGNGHTLTAVGSPWTAPGRTVASAGGTYFTSANGLGPNSSLTDYSLMFWVYCPTFTNAVHPDGYTAMVANGTFFVEIQGNNSGAQGVVNLVWGGAVLYSPNPITASSWHHIAGTRNSTGSVLTMYIDGVSVATGTGAAVNFGTGTWWIGNSPAGSEQGITGLRIDDFRVFDTCLTLTEITAFMNTPVNYPFLVTSPAASALYR